MFDDVFSVGVEIKPIVYMDAKEFDDCEWRCYLFELMCWLTWRIPEREQFGLFCGKL